MEVKIREQIRTGKRKGRRGKREKGEGENLLFPESDSNLGSAKDSFPHEVLLFSR